VRGVVGRSGFRPDAVVADRGYDHDSHRRLVRKRGVTPVIARRKTVHGSGLGRVRWVAERTFAPLHHLKRLLVRFRRVEAGERLQVTVSRRPVAELAPLGRSARISGAALERVLREAPADRALLDDLAPVREQTVEHA
jgi:antitoxin (DNA-binding transcriptional repressor) of toxin-antitoxin stability system